MTKYVPMDEYDDALAAYAALPPLVQDAVRREFVHEQREQFRSMHIELVDGFLAQPEIEQQFEQWCDLQWEEWQRDSHEAWCEYVVLVMSSIPQANPLIQ